MPMNFQDARGIDLQASPINDIAGNNNVQSSPSHNVNCGNTTNNIVSNSNNDSSVRIGGMVNRYGDMPSDLIYLASLIHGESQGARPCRPAARNHLMPWQHADSGRTRQARVTAQQNVPLEDLLQLEVEHACLESGTREEALAEWQEHRARDQEWIHAQPRRFPTHITQHAHFQSAPPVTCSQTSLPVRKYSDKNPFLRILEHEAAQVPHLLSTPTRGTLSFDEAMGVVEEADQKTA